MSVKSKKPNYRSKFEKTVADKLSRLKIKVSYESDVFPYVIHSNYVPDFKVLTSGTILEVKGVLDYADRRKMIAVKKAHPELRIVFVFMKPNNKVPQLKMKHWEWAEKHGFEWCSIEDLKRYAA